MENLFFYLLKSSGLIAVFFLAYYFLLRKETFFKSNRWFLLFGLVTSVILPLVTFKKVIWVAPAPVYHWVNAPMAVGSLAPAPAFEINSFLVLACVYAIGILVFLLKFAFDFSNLARVLRGKTVTQQADFKFIDVTEKVSPFSYFNYIVYNSSLYSEADLDHILEHEKVHCEQVHSADVLVSRLFCILFWYNPFIWLYQKAILQNLEFIADSEALKNITDKKAYQITLLKVTTHDNCVSITNHFYQSLIKKRIIMLNKNQSKKSNSWKYFFILPVLAAFLFYFQVKVIAQERNAPPAPEAVVKNGTSVVIDKNTTDEQLKTESKRLKELGITLKFSNVKRNSSGEIVSIKAQYKDKDGHTGTSQMSGNEPIKPIRFFSNGNGQIGFGNSKQIIIRNGNDNNEDNIAEIEYSSVEAPEVPEAPEAPEALEPLDDLDDIAAPEAPEQPTPPAKGRNGQKIIIKRSKDKNGVMTMTVNGETVTIDSEKIVADALANVDFDFNFDFDSADLDESTQKQMKMAKIQIEKVRPQMERAKRQMERMRSRNADSRDDMDQAQEELEQSKREIEQSKKELEESKQQFEQAKAAFERQKAAAPKKKAEKQK